MYIVILFLQKYVVSFSALRQFSSVSKSNIRYSGFRFQVRCRLELGGQMSQVV